ncbi:MAG: metal ABC transporter ATP-binding protein [Candidatus Micrarchaeota archaeon]
MEDNVLELENVNFSYSGVPTISNASFALKKGDFLGLIGPNGGGKTTLVKLILGLLTPSSGKIRLFGKDIGHFNERHRIGYVPQKATNFDANFPASVYEVASMGRVAKAGLLRQLGSKDRLAVGQALELVGMLKFKDQRIGDLSGGQQQRVFIARALAAESELLILDEPTVGVDKQAQHAFYTLLNRLNKEFGMTLILVSHDIEVVSKNANKIICANIAVTSHDVSRGFSAKELECAYSADFRLIPHHHHE